MIIYVERLDGSSPRYCGSTLPSVSAQPVDDVKQKLLIKFKSNDNNNPPSAALRGFQMTLNFSKYKTL